MVNWVLPRPLKKEYWILLYCALTIHNRPDHQPLFGKGARAPPPKGGTQTRHERAAEIEPRYTNNPGQKTCILVFYAWYYHVAFRFAKHHTWYFINISRMLIVLKVFSTPQNRKLNGFIQFWLSWVSLKIHPLVYSARSARSFLLEALIWVKYWFMWSCSYKVSSITSHEIINLPWLSWCCNVLSRVKTTLYKRLVLSRTGPFGPHTSNSKEQQ